MTITNELLDELEAKAKAAIEDGIEEGFDYDPSIGMTLGETRFACAANPATILALVEHIRSQAERLETIPCWIGVEDRMPAPNVKVLAHSKRCPSFFAVHKNRKERQWEFVDGDTCHERITHWMPLPAAPAIAQEGADHE